MTDNSEIIDRAEIPGRNVMVQAVDAVMQEDAQKDDKPITDIAESSTIDIGKALTLRLKNGLSYREIAKQLNCSRSGVHKRLSQFEALIKDPGSLTAYDQNRAELLNSAELTMLNEMVDSDKLKKASVNNVAYAYSTLFNARRLDKGESTANVNHHILRQTVSELDREEALLRAEMEGN